MHAFGPGLPLMTAKPALMRPAHAFPAQDPFQAVLQGRMVAHLKRVRSNPPNMQKMEGVPLSGRQKGADQLSGSDASRRRREAASRQFNPAERRLPPELLPELAGLLLQAGFPPERLQTLLTDPQVQEQGLSLEELRRAWQEAAGAGTLKSLFSVEAETLQVSKVLPDEALPPALASLLDVVKQSPGGVLPITASRQPEIAALLGEAGFSPSQVEALLNSPQVQEYGLTAEALRAAWMKAVHGSQAEGKERFQPGTMGQVTSHADYQRLWERLRLPIEAFPDLRLALQQLGASPEALAGLEEYATPQGIPVGQVWRVIKQCLREGQEAISPGSAAPSGKQGELADPLSGEEVEQWRQLLLQTGFSPEVVDGLLGMQAPASTAELRARLAALAPSPPPPQTQDAPKPLYLPENLRLRSLWWENRMAPESGFGKSPDGQAQASDTGESFLLHSPASENQGSFASFLTSLAAPHLADVTGMGGSVFGPMTPEVGQAFWSQLEAGILGNLQPGESRLNLVLNPPQLGQIELTLNLRGEDLAVTAMITRPEVAHLAGAGVEQLVQALSQHGLVLSQFQVRVREGGPDPVSLLATEQKMMGKKEQGSEGGESARRRRTNRVDRFV